MDQKILSAFIPSADTAMRSNIGEVLNRFGTGTLAFCAKAGITIHPLFDGERYDEASPALQTPSR